MAKIDAHTGQDSPLAQAVTHAAALGRPETKGRSEQPVTISEEGKKKQVLGQLMSSFFHAEKTVGRLDR